MNIIESYVKRRWCVSTAPRQSSAAAANGASYYETLVFEWDHAKRELGRLADQQHSGLSEGAALRSHADICAALAVQELDNSEHKPL